MRDTSADCTAKIARYYDAKIGTFGPCAHGADWREEASQVLRFDQFARLLPQDAPFTLLDVGCGYGALLTYLRQRNYDCRYCGIDLSASMIAHAQALHGADARARFEQSADTRGVFDYVVASGIFNVRMDIPDADWEAWTEAQAGQIGRQARRGIALNFLTDRADKDKMRPDLHYANPARWLAWGLGLSRHVALLHDYGLWEFTLLIELDPT